MSTGKITRIISDTPTLCSLIFVDSKYIAAKLLIENIINVVIKNANSMSIPFCCRKFYQSIPRLSR
jgi:hypothetical protein